MPVMKRGGTYLVKPSCEGEITPHFDHPAYKEHAILASTVMFPAYPGAAPVAHVSTMQ